PPQFDLVRIDKAGAGLVAGRGDADSEVEIISDGEVVGAARTGRDGAFVAYILVDPAKGVQSLTARHRRATPDVEDPEPQFRAAATPVVVVSDPEADAEPVIVQPTAEGVAVIQAAPRVSAEQVSLDAISYDAEGRVVFAGRAAVGQGVRLYLDGQPIAEVAPADDSSWRTQADERVSPGVYTLRVDQIDAAGKVTSRLETPFQRELITQGALGENALTVQTGNNLWKLAEKYYGEGIRYTLIYKANEQAIKDPDLIYPGQIFKLPDEPRSDE
ncbi:MAG: LysM peptidoglycan-binding domain-containing protein, partial [Pseudomonadota bacterium]